MGPAVPRILRRRRSQRDRAEREGLPAGRGGLTRFLIRSVGATFPSPLRNPTDFRRGINSRCEGETATKDRAETDDPEMESGNPYPSGTFPRTQQRVEG
ncbi:hypothetical protein NDU88_000676 [Pleurodeles waltl]|uniref:Uncharacterized protein n=1 Tax=Pleurodeles waltl TaxID=8319 RepID=A0AAV7Q1I5_PLEWA|nr:hypothetical protein NDU88_000676 [Pleurodeles waltl]